MRHKKGNHMLELKNLGLLLIINGVFCFPITTGIFNFFKVVGCEINSQKKGEMRCIVFLSLFLLSVWFYLVFSALFRWQL
jgi:hypothetical protein